MKGVFKVVLLALLAPFLANNAAALEKFSLADVAAHNSKADCWVVYSGKVFDASALVADCPADAEKVAAHCGSDVTEFLRVAHKKHFDAHLEIAGVAHCPAHAFKSHFVLKGELA